jgi:tRNA A-37 threonylcarbamoyl transferase component Bud32
MNIINGGGIMLPYSKQELSKKIFTYYLNNFAQIIILSTGRYGIVLLLLLPDNIDSSIESNFFKQMTPNDNYGKIVKQLIIKIQFINNYESEVKMGDYEFTGIKEQQMQDEINIQTDVFFKTFKYMQPLCPSIIHAEIIKDFGEKQYILNILRSVRNLPFPVVNSIIYNNDIGIIVMEMIHNSLPLYNFINNGNNNYNIQLAKNISRYALLKLALDTGYGHNDFHEGNILIQNDDTYFKNTNISPILIDFGRTKKLDLDILDSIKQKVKEKNYISALAQLCKPYNTRSPHTRNINASYYNWVCGDYEGLNQSGALPDIVNLQIDQLFKNRELAIDEIIKKMSILHDAEPNKYPLLPLSNEIKNKLYNGMIGGRIKRIIKQKQKQKQKQKTKKYKLYKKNKKSKIHKTYRLN